MLFCLEERYIEDGLIQMVFLGGNKLHNFAQRPAIGTGGGIRLLWDEQKVVISHINTATYCLSALIHIRDSDTHFSPPCMVRPLLRARTLSLPSSSPENPLVGCGLYMGISTKYFGPETRTNEISREVASTTSVPY